MPAPMLQPPRVTKPPMGSRPLTSNLFSRSAILPRTKRSVCQSRNPYRCRKIQASRPTSRTAAHEVWKSPAVTTAAGAGRVTRRTGMPMRNAGRHMSIVPSHSTIRTASPPRNRARAHAGSVIRLLPVYEARITLSSAARRQRYRPSSAATHCSTASSERTALSARAHQRSQGTLENRSPRLRHVRERPSCGRHDKPGQLRTPHRHKRLAKL